MTQLDDLAEEWRSALESWAIPPAILDAAPVSPWIHPPKMFRMADDDGVVPDTASFHQARAALEGRGSVLDIGCGGGRSSLPLGPLITRVTGVDESEAMLTQFRAAAAARSIECITVLGRWPDVSTVAGRADLVVCHHVAYNVADIVPFLQALTDHADRRVVMELTAYHPQSSLNALWLRFWGLARPVQPTYELLVEIVRAMGFDPVVETAARAPRRGALDRPELVAFMRQRLCLTSDRDPDIDSALGADPVLAIDEFATVAWSPL